MRTRNPGLRCKIGLPLILLVVCLVLAACGSSSTSTTQSASAGGSAGASAGATGSTGPAGGRFTALRQCLSQHGITLPQRTAGQGRTPGQGRPPGGATGRGGFFGGGAGATGGRGFFRPPAGVSASQFAAALKACGGGAGFGAGRAPANNPSAVTALTKFATCMRSNGVNLPAPNTSGGGPVFNTKGLSTTSASFRAADAKCAPDLRGTFFGRGRGAGATGAAAPSTG